MPTRRRLATLPLLLLTVGPPAAAQRLAPAAARPVHAPLSARAAAFAPPRTPGLVAGGLVGGALGLLAGGAAGLLVARDCDEDGGDDLCALDGALVGSAVGMSAGIPLGVHLAGGRRGPLGASTLASLAIGAAGVAALAATHYDRPWAPVLLVATPAAQLAAAVALERRGR